MSVLQPCAMVIFGGAGDLAGRKLVPAIFSLLFYRLPPDRFAIIGVDVKPMDDPAYRGQLREGVEKFSRQAKSNPRHGTISPATFLFWPRIYPIRMPTAP